MILKVALSKFALRTNTDNKIPVAGYYFQWHTLLTFHKKFVEYIYKNTSSSRVYSITLNPMNFVFQSSETSEIIPYAAVTSVRLFSNNGLFKLILNSETHLPITVTNRYYLPNGEQQDISRQYNTFVRVLHYHLKDKSTALYSTGSSWNNLIIQCVLAAAACFILSFLSAYLDVNIMNPIVQGVILTALVVIAIISLNINHLPKDYNPEEIPLLFLPDFWK